MYPCFIKRALVRANNSTRYSVTFGSDAEYGHATYTISSCAAVASIELLILQYEDCSAIRTK